MAIRKARMGSAHDDQRLGEIGGFGIWLEGAPGRLSPSRIIIEFDHGPDVIEIDDETSPLGLIARIEHRINGLDMVVVETTGRRNEAERRLPAYESRLGQAFADVAELTAKRAELAALELDIASTGTEVAAEPETVVQDMAEVREGVKEAA